MADHHHDHTCDHEHDHEHDHSHEHGLPIPEDGNFDLTPISQDHLSEKFQFLESLAASIPPEWRSKPIEEQKSLLVHLLNTFRRHEGIQEEKFSKLRSDYQNLVRTQYKFLHPELLQINSWEFDKEFIKAFQAENPNALGDFLCEESDLLYSFPMLKPTFCKKIVDEIDHFEKWSAEHGLEVHRPNSMNNYGAILDDFGMQGVLDEFMKLYVKRITQAKFPQAMHALDHHHGFAVEYEVGKDVKLDFHVDDSEITLNLCLGVEFEGGELFFGGIRCPLHQQIPPRQDEAFLVGHQPGCALIHLGRHRHAATPIRSGRRMNMILWCRSSEWRKVDNVLGCPDWCGIRGLPDQQPPSS